MKTTRLLQVSFLVLLVVSFAQVGWWIIDEGLHSRATQSRILDLYGRDARAATALLRAGESPARVRSLYPHLELSADRRVASVDPAAVARLHDERWHRLNRYGWEGVFFLAVLAGGMVILYRALRQERLLRRRQQNFLAAVSHELKSPLASLKLAVETLELREPDPEGRRRLLHRMMSDLERLEGMMANVLDSARLQAGRVALAPERLELAQAVRQALDLVRETATAAGVTLTADVAPGLAVEADAHALRTVLRNLLDNAVKATAARGGGTVSVRAAPGGSHVRLEVADDGIGIPRGEERRIFEKFYRPGEELNRTTRGSGLGLYIVRRLVELGRGRVAARSRGPGQGAVFTVEWPAGGEAAP